MISNQRHDIALISQALTYHSLPASRLPTSRNQDVTRVPNRSPRHDKGLRKKDETVFSIMRTTIDLTITLPISDAKSRNHPRRSSALEANHHPQLSSRQPISQSVITRSAKHVQPFRSRSGNNHLIQLPILPFTTYRPA